MNRVAVLGSTDSWYLRDLQRAAEGRIDVFAAPFRRMKAVVDGSRQTSVEVSAPEGVWSNVDAALVRTMPAGSLEQVVFRMDALASLEQSGVRVVNSAKAVETSVDKFLTTARLHAAGLPVPRTAACQTVDDALPYFHAWGCDVVVKPLFGSEGRGLMRITDDGLFERACSLFAAQGAVLYVQEFLRHPGYDLRALVVGRRVLGMRRAHDSDWRTNASRGATCSPHPLTDLEIELALRSASAVGAEFAGVDLLPTVDGRLFVLEVNAVPGWQALSRALQVDIARLVLDLLSAERSCLQSR